MTTGAIVQQIIEEVEARTGCPVEVVRDPTLKLMAKVDIARDALKLHRIAIKPTFAIEADYLTCFQCGCILRKFGVPAEERVDLASSIRGRTEAEKLVKNHFKGKPFPAAMIDSLTQQLFDGLILQLLSIPVGLRVDAWIAVSYPELATQQKAMVNRQLEENATTLKPEVKAVAPERIIKASVAMNAAYAAFWARLRGDEKVTLPYRSAGKAQVGSELLGIFDATPANPAYDRALVDAWGKHLSVDGWYEWIPHRLD